MSRGPILALALVVSLTAGAAAAQLPGDAESRLSREAPDSWLRRPLVLEAQFGGGTPLGTTGVAIGYTPVRWATLSGGVGLAQGSLQVAFIPRVHQPLTDTLALGLGAGVSLGPSDRSGRDGVRRALCQTCDEVPERSYALAWWGNAELSVEERRPWGLVWRAFAGGARLLNPSDGTCAAGGCADHPIVVYVGAAVGWAFAI